MNPIRFTPILHFIHLCKLQSTKFYLETAINIFFYICSGLTSIFLIFGLFGTILEHLINFDAKINLKKLQRQEVIKYEI